MKKELLLICIVLATGSVFMNLSVLSARNVIHTNNYTGNYYNNINPDEISIFPNPVVGKKLTIAAENPFDMIEILNIVGSSVIMQEFDLGIYKVVLNIENLDKGIYIVKVKFNSNIIVTEKITVQ